MNGYQEVPGAHIRQKAVEWMDLLDLTAVELGKKIKSKEVSVAEAVKAALAQAKAVESEINSYVTLDEAGALVKAEEIQKKIDSGELAGPLAGVPAAVKDNMCVEGQLTTCSSKILSNYIPTFTAEAVKNLQKAGAVLLGKTNMDEFAMGSTTETSYYGPTKNPHNLMHVPGGSSGGSCAGVAAQGGYIALVHTDPIQAAPSASPVRSAAWWGSNPPTARFHATG